MSRTIDQRVVEMKFDNKQFESAVNQSRQSIQLMEKDLSLLDGAKSLTNLDKAISNVDFSHMSKSLDKIKGSLSILGTIGRSAVNKMTTDAMNSLQTMVHKIESSITNLGKQIYERGYNRAKNLEDSAFKIEGLLKRAELEAVESAEIQKKLSDMINDSVTDTAFGLDQASLVASTLASTFGTDEKALGKIQKALRAVSGVAGTTGAAYEQVADIFTDAAGKGRAMGDEFSRMSLLGISAQEEVAKYVNKNIKLQNKLNKVLKKNQKHIITGDEILSLASKKQITADIFVGAFEGFIDTAKEANDTMEGVTDNIGAAIGRLGAMFIQPIIQNRGPLVQFLQVVKDGISSVAKILSNLKLPDYITTFFNETIKVAAENLKKFVKDLKNGLTPLNEFFDKLTTAVERITLLFDLTDENLADAKRGKKSLYKQYFVEAAEADKYLEDEIKKQGKKYTSLSKMQKKLGKKGNKESKGISKSEKEYLKQINDGNPKTLKEWQALYKTKIKSDFSKTLDWKADPKKAKETLKAFTDSTAFVNSYKSAAFEKYHEQLSQLVDDENRLAKIDAEVKQRMEETDIFGYDYLSNFIKGFKNILGGIANVFKTIGEVVFGADGPLSDFFNIFTASDDDLKDSRKSLNKFSEDFKKATEKFREFTKDNEGVKTVLETIGKVFKVVGKILSGVFTVVGAIAKALAPLFGKIFNALTGLLGLGDESSKEASTFDKIISALCGVIEWLGKVLEDAWDTGVKIVEWLKENGVFDIIVKIKDKLVEFAKYVFNNWPTIWENISTKLKGFGDYAKKAAGWIYDKLQPAIEFVKPYIEKLADKISDLTNGFIDLKKPVKWIKDLFGGTSGEADSVSTAIENVTDKLDELKGTANDGTTYGGAIGDGLLKGRFGFDVLGPVKNAFSSGGSLDTSLSISDEEVKNAKESKKKIGIISNLFEDFDNDKDKSLLSHLKGYFSWLSDIIWWIKTKLFLALKDKDVVEMFKWLIDVFGKIASIFVAGKILTVVSTAVDGIKNFSIALSGYDSKVANKEATAKILKMIAIIIGVFAASVLAISYSIYTLGKMRFKDLLQGMVSFAIISMIIGGIIAMVYVFASFLTGETKTDGYKGINIAGIHLPSFGFTGYDSQYIKESPFKMLIGVAAIIAVFAASVLAITGAISILGHMQPTVLDQGMKKFITISLLIMGLVALVLLFAFAMLNPNASSNSSLISAKIGGIKKINKKKVDKGSLGGLGTGLGVMFFGVAAIIHTFASAVTKIAAALQILSLIPAGDMDRSFAIFGGVAGIMLLLVGAVLVFAYAMLHDPKNKNTDKLAKNIIFVFLGVAAILLIFARATKIILKAISNVAIVSKFADLDKSIDAFETVAVALFMITALALGSAFVISKFSKSPAALKNITKVLGLTALILAVFAISTRIIMKAIGSLAKNLSGATEQEMKTVTDLTYAIMIALGLIVLVIMSFAVYMQKVNLTKAQAQKIQGLLIIVAVILAVISLPILAIGYAADKMKGLSSSKTDKLLIALGIVGIIVAILMGFIFVLTKSGITKAQAQKIRTILISLSIVMAVFGACTAAIGLAAKMMKDVDKQSMEYLLWGMGIIGAIIAGLMIFAAVASKVKGIEIGIKAVKSIVIALGVLFALIGAAAYLIGKGADLFVGAIERFMDAMERFATIKDKKIKKGAKKVGKAIENFMMGIVEGIIEFGNKCGEKEEDLKKAIMNILNIIQGAITTFWTTLESNILTRLGEMIDMFGPWLSQYGPKLIKIFKQIENILWFGCLEPLFYDLKMYIWNELKNIAKYLYDNRDPILNKMIEVGTEMLVSMGKAITNNEDKIISALRIAIHSLVNLLFAFLGLPKPFDDVQEEIKQFNKSKQPSGAGEEMDNQFAEGVKKGTENAVGAVRKFVTAVGDALWEAMWTNESVQKAADYISQMANNWLHPWESKEFMILSGEAQKQITKKSAEYMDNLMKHGMSKKDAAAKATAYGYMLAKQMLKGIDDPLAISSPSKAMEQRGKWIDQGLANGIKEDTDLVVSSIYAQTDHINSAYDAALFKMRSNMDNLWGNYAASGNIFKDLGDNFKSAATKISKVIKDSGLFDTDKFIIKPGMDLSSITKDSKQLQKIFDSLGLSNVNAKEAIGLFDNLKSGNFNKIDVTSLANGFDSANDKNGKSSSKNSGNSIGSINFTQNNYSPEALSQIDIYRNTENLLGKKSTLNSLASAAGLTGTNY